MNLPPRLYLHTMPSRHSAEPRGDSATAIRYRHNRGIATSCLLVLLSGCGTFGNYYVVDPALSPQGTKEVETSQGKAEVINLDDTGNKGLYDQANGCVITQQDRASPDLKNCQVARNRLQSRIVILSDKICDEHKGRILANATAFNVGLGGLTSLFSGMATLVTGTGAKTLSAASTVTNSSRSLVNAEAYLNTMAATIVGAIDQERNARKKLIDANRAKSVQDYPMDTAIEEAQEYHLSCSFANGLRIVQEKVVRTRPTDAEIKAKIADLEKQYAENATKIETVTKRSSTPSLGDKAQQELLEAQNKVLLESVLSLSKSLAN